jgi:pyruvate formate lyase activating enzyme
MQNGIITNIQRYSLDDGDGIRTTVFLKGCPLFCKWCHNPENINNNIEIMFDNELCVNCRACVNICENNCHSIVDNIHLFNRENCSLCGKCLKVCLQSALYSTGKYVIAQEVMEIVLKDKDYYVNSNGGLTISGGEPLFQTEFSKELLTLAKKECINTAVETCGFCKFEDLLEISEVTDTFLYDIKDTNSKRLLNNTGADLFLILKNLFKLNKLNKRIIVRCPIIENINLDKEHFKNIGRISEKLKNVSHIELLSYHSMGMEKLIKLGKKNCFLAENLSKESLLEYVNYAKQYTTKQVVVL